MPQLFQSDFCFPEYRMLRFFIKILHNLSDTMQQSPCQKLRRAAMPQTADEKNKQYIALSDCKSLFAAAKGNINIVPQPAAQRNVPSAPEIRQVFGKIGLLKVLDQLKAKQSADTDCDHRIACKIAIDLNRIEKCRHQHRKAVGILIHAVNLIHKDFRPLRDDQLHSITEQHRYQPLHDPVVI